MRSFATPLVAAAIMALGAGCSSLNPFAASAPKPAPLVEFKPSVELVSRWEASIGSSGPYVFQPAVVGDAVYAAAHNGKVARYQDGKAQWTTDVDTRLSAGAASDGRLVVVVSTEGEVIALDAQTGTQRWRAPSGAEVLAAPAVGESVVVVRASDSRLIGFDAKDGTRRWVSQRPTPPLALRSFAGMAVQGDVVIAGYPGGKLAAVNIGNGGALWELTVATPRGNTELERVADVAGTPVFGRREVCAVTYQGRAACFDATNGNAVWARDFSSSVGMARDTRFVYITDENDSVHALDAFSGSSVWKQDALPRRGVSRPAAVGEFVAVGDREGYLHLLKRDSGEFAARVRIDRSAIAADPVALGNSAVLVQTRDGTLRALEAR